MRGNSAGRRELGDVDVRSRSMSMQPASATTVMCGVCVASSCSSSLTVYSTLHKAA